MHHAVSMRVVQRVGHIACDADGLVDAELCFAIELCPQRLAFDEGHDVVQESIRRAGVEERKDVRVLERRGRPDLYYEALGAEDSGKLRLEHLYGDLAFGAQVVSEIDGCHASLPELPLQPIMSGECSGKARWGGSHRRRMKRAGRYG